MFKTLLFIVAAAALCNGSNIPQIGARDAAYRVSSSILSYQLYTKENHRQGVKIDVDNIKESLQPGRKVVFLVHGIQGHQNGISTFYTVLKDALFTSDPDLNVITLDWSAYATFPYATAISFVPSIADNMANVINKLVESIEDEGDDNDGAGGDENVGVGSDENAGAGSNENIGAGSDENVGAGSDENAGAGSDENVGSGGDDNTGACRFTNVRDERKENNDLFSLTNIHLVGFDVGAHLVGKTGRLLGGEVARITALDPARTNWGTDSERLRESDAKYVEVIHTDTGTAAAAFGIIESIGSADFYPNGGVTQTGCTNNLCNHDRAWELFAASLSHVQLSGNRCLTMAQMTSNTCTMGPVSHMGNNDLDKFAWDIIRVNTGRIYPYEV